MEEKKDVCMACQCPCDTHKEHTHAMTTCSMCGHTHKDDGSCHCGCK